jgi:P-aminobenzoate N-oxygenase AurF
MQDMNTSLVDKLVHASRKHARNPYEYIEWPETLEREAWHVSPELCSIYGTRYWDELDDPARKRLSFFEAVNFFSLNIHGEKMLMEGLSARLYVPGQPRIAQYIHHFLDEENKHSVLFGGFCQRYAGKIYPDRKLAISRQMSEGEADLLFYAKVLIFEELADAYNLAMAQDERLHWLSRKINENHHYEEVRHLVFGRQMVKDLLAAHGTGWSTEKRRELGDYLGRYLESTWREYYQPDVYQDHGFPDPWSVMESAWDHPAQREHRRRTSAKCVSFLLENGLLTGEPSP